MDSVKGKMSQYRIQSVNPWIRLCLFGRVRGF